MSAAAAAGKAATVAQANHPGSIGERKADGPWLWVFHPPCVSLGGEKQGLQVFEEAGQAQAGRPARRRWRCLGRAYLVAMATACAAASPRRTRLPTLGAPHFECASNELAPPLLPAPTAPTATPPDPPRSHPRLQVPESNTMSGPSKGVMLGAALGAAVLGIGLYMMLRKKDEKETTSRCDPRSSLHAAQRAPAAADRAAPTIRAHPPPRRSPARRRCARLLTPDSRRLRPRPLS